MLVSMNSPKTSQETMTDPAALRFNQACIVVSSTLSLLLGAPWLVASTAAVMLVGTFFPEGALFKRFFTDILRPLLGLSKNLVADDPRAHLFAQGVGGVFLTLATLGYLAGLPLLGGVLTLLVIALALLNLTTGYCVGCQMYFQYKMLKYRLSRG